LSRINNTLVIFELLVILKKKDLYIPENLVLWVGMKGTLIPHYYRDCPSIPRNIKAAFQR